MPNYYFLFRSKDKILLSSTAFTPAMGPSQPPDQWALVLIFAVINRLGLEADHPRPSSAHCTDSGAYVPSPISSGRIVQFLTHKDRLIFFNIMSYCAFWINFILWDIALCSSYVNRHSSEKSVHLAGYMVLYLRKLQHSNCCSERISMAFSPQANFTDRVTVEANG
jgi:hypothetical protein